MRFLDTSIPLCVMTGKPEKDFDQCLKIMEKIEKGEEKVVTTVFTIAEISYILSQREKFTSEEVKVKILSLLDCIGLKLLDIEAGLCRDAIEITEKYKVDFVDSYNFLTMKKQEIREIYSLDPHYDRFKEIERVILSS